jgi:ATP-dependent DNA helicase RecQ
MMGVIASQPEARAVLRDVFGYPDFRPGQNEAVAAVASGSDVVVLLPTGQGKSLCYQVPAIAAARAGRGTTVVISPLIALMHDQVSALCGRGVRAAALHSQQDADEQKHAVAAFLRGELALLYVSPERASSPSFRRMLGRTRIALLAIDEAHCVSQWGHDFRPDYLRIHELRQVVDAPVLALTATATSLVMEEISNGLSLLMPRVVQGDLSRENLAFRVQHLRTQSARQEVLEEELEAAGLRPRRGDGRAIVYCSTRRVTESVAKALREKGFPVGFYHAGRTKFQRERAHLAFEARRTRILVATNAFGMGIDLPDIRLLVHFQAPGSLEAYYQEAGRAGRDGAPSRCLLFFGAADVMTQKRLASSADSKLTLRHERALAAVEAYARGGACRQQMISSHFTGSDEHSTCGKCDVCMGDADEQRFREEAKPVPKLARLPESERDIVFEAVGRLSRPVGKLNLARALRGSKAKSLSRGGLLSMPEYGKLSHRDEASIVATIESLLSEGRLKRTGSKYPTVWIPGKPIRGAAPATREGGRGRVTTKRGSLHRGGSVARALDNYRNRTARQLKWKAYMVFQKRTIVAIEQELPDSHAALARIPGLGPAKIERFGDDILALVREHGSRD